MSIYDMPASLERMAPEVFLGILEEHPGFLTMHPDFSKE